jgi:hypothetical protein
VIRYYLAPMVIMTNGFRGPKYVDSLARGTQWEAMDYGNEPSCILAIDTDAATHAALAANADVAAFPLNIDNQVGANLVTVQTQLESFNLPGDAVTLGSTYRAVMRGIIAIMSVMQRYTAITSNVLLFSALVNLDRTLGSIAVQTRNALQQACDELGYDTRGLTGASTIRDLLKRLATQPHDVTLLGVII